MIRPTVKVYPLPELPEDQLIILFDKILEALKRCSFNPPVRSEKDVLIHFPKNMMKMGLGDDLTAEIILPKLAPEKVRFETIVHVGDAIFDFFVNTLGQKSPAIDSFTLIPQTERSLNRR